MRSEQYITSEVRAEDLRYLDLGYVEAWRPILMDWLEWPERRFEAWIISWNDQIEHVDYMRVWFYHEEPFYYVLPLLAPEDLVKWQRAEWEQGRDTRYGESIYDRIDHAVRGCPVDPSWGGSDFDWDAAKERAEKVLNRYGASLPGPYHVSSYERQIVEMRPA